MADDFSADFQQREAEFQKGFAALNAQTDKAQAERQKVLKPAREQVEKALDAPKPGIPGEAGGPELPKTPEPPKSNFQQDAVQWMAISAVISGIAGALTRRHATNALNAFAGAINGFRQGKMDVYEQQYKTWQQENQKVQEETKNLWERRKAILDDRKMNIDEKMSRLQLLDSETGDQVNYQVAQQKNFTLYTHNQDMLSLKLEGLKLQTEKLNNAKQAMDDKSVQATGLTLAQMSDAQRRIFQEVKSTAPPGETEQQFMARYQKAWQSSGIGVVGQSVEAVADLIGQGKMAPLSAFALRSQWGQQVMALVKEKYPDFSGTEFKASQETEVAFAKGPEARSVRSINVAIDHLATADQLVDALKNGDVQRFNQFKNRWAVETGSAAPTNLESAALIIGQEMVKAVVTAGGGVTERTAAADAFSNVKSPEQLHGAIQTVRRLLAGQLKGLERQYESGTGGRRDFGEVQRLSPQAREALKGLSSEEQGGKGGGSAHKAGDIITVKGKQYRVLGGDPNDPDVEEVK